VNGLAAGTSSFAILLQDGTIETVDAATGRITHQVRRPDLASTDTGDPFAVSPAGTQVAFSSTDGVTPLLLDLGRPTAQPVRLPAQSAGIGTLAFAPGGKEIGVASQTGSVAVYATSDGAAVSSFKGHSGAVHGMAWVGTTRPTALYTSGLDSQIISWNLATAPRLLRRSGPVVPLPDHAEAFGTLLVGATPNQGNGPGDGPEDIYALDTTTGKYRSWPLGPTADVYVNQTVASADGHYALVSIQDPHTDWTNHIEIWDLRRGAKIGTLHIPAASVAFFAGLNAAISPDGKVAVCSLDATSVGVFDLPSGRLLRNYPVRFAPPDANRVTVVPWQFDPAGHLLLAGFDSGPPQAAPPGGGSDKPANAANQRFALMDVTTGHILAQTGLGDIVAPSALAWSRDGKLLALGTRVGTLKLYDAATLRQVADAGPVVPGYVLSASFSPDNRSLVVGDTGGEMTVFTVPDLSREGTAIQFTDAPSGWWFAFYNSAGDIDGLAPSGPDGGSSQWFTFPGRSSELLATACQLAGTDITPAQWTRYVGDQPYQHVCPSR
jgi:WD40 repeat protein